MLSGSIVLARAAIVVLLSSLVTFLTFLLSPYWGGIALGLDMSFFPDAFNSFLMALISDCIFHPYLRVNVNRFSNLR